MYEHHSSHTAPHPAAAQAPHARGFAGPVLSDRIALLDFQHLMRQHGHSVDLLRLQRDPCYAQQCLGEAILTPSAELRACARRLCASFILDA